jgi:uncharacterized protein HemY
MDIVWSLLLLVLVLVSLWYVRRFRRAGTAFYWPWFDSRRGVRAQQAYIAEEEIKRTSSARDRDLAP